MRERQKYTGRLLLTESPRAAFQVNRSRVSQASLNHTKPLTDKTSPHWNAVENSPLLIPSLMNGEKLKESKSLFLSLSLVFPHHVLHLTHTNWAFGNNEWRNAAVLWQSWISSTVPQVSADWKLISFALISWHQWAAQIRHQLNRRKMRHAHAEYLLRNMIANCI